MGERQAYYDNLKFILMLFVVFGHFAFEYRSERLMISVCNAIYTFHMPVFIFVSGYFSRNIKVQRWADVWQLLIPYFTLEIVHLIWTKVTHMGYGNASILTPTYHNWYMLSLFYWRMIIPFFKHFKPLYSTLLIFSMSILAGWIPQLNDFAAGYRSLFFFPLFAVGYYSKDISIATQVNTSKKLLAIGLLTAFISFIFYSSYTDMEQADQLLYAYAPMYGYDGLLNRMLLRIASLFSGFACGFLFLFAVPHHQTFYTKMGTKTLYVYVIHMFLVWPIIQYGFDYSPIRTLTVSILCSAVITYLLSSELVSKVFRPLLDPRYLISKLKF